MRVPAPAEAGHDGCQSQGPKETNLLDVAPPYPASAGLRTQICLANSRHERTSEDVRHVEECCSHASGTSSARVYFGSAARQSGGWNQELTTYDFHITSARSRSCGSPRRGRQLDVPLLTTPRPLRRAGRQHHSRTLGDLPDIALRQHHGIEAIEGKTVIQKSHFKIPCQTPRWSRWILVRPGSSSGALIPTHLA